MGKKHLKLNVITEWRIPVVVSLFGLLLILLWIWKWNDDTRHQVFCKPTTTDGRTAGWLDRWIYFGRMNRDGWVKCWAGFMENIMIKSGDDGKLFLFCIFFVGCIFLARLRLEDDYRFQPSWHSFSLQINESTCVGHVIVWCKERVTSNWALLLL